MSSQHRFAENFVVRLPDVGDFRDIPVIEILVKPGDFVDPEDALVTLESDKATMDVPAPIPGIVAEVMVNVGSKVSEGDPLVSLVPAIRNDAMRDTGNASKGERQRLEDPSLDKGIRVIEEKLTLPETHILGRNQPAAFLGSLAPTIRRTQCFLVMPYSQPWSAGVESIVDESCKMAGFQIVVAKSMNGRFIPHDIWQGITGSGVIIADLTAGNANVAYEVGLADALGREVVLICQSAEVPFDFAGQRLLIYENTLSGAAGLRQALEKRLLDIRGREKTAGDYSRSTEF